MKYVYCVSYEDDWSCLGNVAYAARVAACAAALAMASACACCSSVGSICSSVLAIRLRDSSMVVSCGSSGGIDD